MKPEDSDSPLRDAFHRLRHAEREEAPAWNPELLATPFSAPGSRAFFPARRRWLPLTSLAAAALAMTIVLFPSKPKRSLAAELPVLLPPATAQEVATPLLAGLDERPWSAMGSDSLMPRHLTISLP